MKANFTLSLDWLSFGPFPGYSIKEITSFGPLPMMTDSETHLTQVAYRRSMLLFQTWIWNTGNGKKSVLAHISSLENGEADHYKQPLISGAVGWAFRLVHWTLISACTKSSMCNKTCSLMTFFGPFVGSSTYREVTSSIYFLPNVNEFTECNFPCQWWPTLKHIQQK